MSTDLNQTRMDHLFTQPFSLVETSGQHFNLLVNRPAFLGGGGKMLLEFQIFDLRLKILDLLGKPGKLHAVMNILSLVSKLILTTGTMLIGIFGTRLAKSFQQAVCAAASGLGVAGDQITQSDAGSGRGAHKALYGGFGVEEGQLDIPLNFRDFVGGQAKLLDRLCLKVDRQTLILILKVCLQHVIYNEAAGATLEHVVNNIISIQATEPTVIQVAVSGVRQLGIPTLMGSEGRR